MGGKGSGRQVYGGRWTVQESQRWRLNISRLTQAGYLSAVGQRWTFWLNWLPLTVDVDLGAHPHIFIQDTREMIKLDWSPVHFGGRRWYFICPGCLHRCLDLYLSKLVYACRVCSELTYDSVKDPQVFKNFYQEFADRRGVDFLEGRRRVKEYEKELRRERKGKWIRRRDRPRFGSVDNSHQYDRVGTMPVEPGQIEAPAQFLGLAVKSIQPSARSLPRKYGQAGMETEVQRQQRVKEARRRNSMNSLRNRS